MKKLLSALFVVLFATSAMAQTGLTCEDPIPVDKSYVGRVEADDELWYTAWTYDLPLHVYFSPDIDDSSWSPEVQIDFTCERGVYNDHKLDSVINILKVMGLELPVTFACDKVVRDGKVEWDLSIDERYRDQLTEYGLTHNIQAFVKVYFPDAGEIRLTPDMTFQNCMENGLYVNLGDTIDIAANDSATMLVLPYSEWKNDSIQFTWIGDEPARVWVAEEECQFTPNEASVYVKAKYDIDQNTPKKLYPADMKAAIKNWIGKGIFFGKVLSNGNGRLVVERIPLGEIQGDAVLLKHGESVQLQANDNQVYCFPKTWKSTEFLANTQYLMAMHVSNTPDFEPGDANVISKYAFSKEGNNRQLQLSVGDIASLAASATDDYLYVRFVCNKATTLTPSLWDISSCVANTVLIQSGESFANDADKVYRMDYSDWAGYAFNVAWDQRGVLDVHVSSFCDVKTTDTQKIQIISVPSRSSVDVPESDVASWATAVDADGFVYMRISSTRQGNVLFTSAKPAETDPEGPVTPDPEYVYESAAICFGETYEWNGQTLTESGKYTHTATAENGAVTITELTLTVYPQTPATTEEVTVEFGATYEWNGVTYVESGIYTITLQDENGCDYQATLVLTVLPETLYTTESAAICFGEAYDWNGTTYTESGEYTYTTIAANGADSIVTLQLTVYPQTPATTEEVTIEFGATYEWNGVVYEESGVYTITLQDENGCDYQATLVLTVLPEPVSPCVAASALLEPVAELTINLQNAVAIYRIDYQAWVASGVNLVWSGAAPLHTFVAKDCEFAVAIYHRDVVNYTEVPAEGNVVLSQSILSGLEQYVDADGYLYVRFLTEFEGQLTTELAE